MPYLYALETQVYAVPEGDNVSMKCRALYGFEKNQKIKWSWYKDDKKILNNHQIKVQVDHLLHQSVLKITNSTKNNTGMYKCIVKNIYGVASRTMRFKVKGILLIIDIF
jgi:hypothetical protein